jgi:hypothetical protein
MPSGDEEATVEREALLLSALLLFEPLLFEPLPFKPSPIKPRLFEPLLFELWLFELLLFVFIAPVVARAFLVAANVYPILFANRGKHRRALPWSSVDNAPRA